MRRPANARREGANEARRGRGARDAGADERKARGGTAGKREARGGERGAALDAGAGGALARRWRDAGHGCGGDTGPWPGAGAMPGGRRARRAVGERAGCPPRVARRCTCASEARAPCEMRMRDRGVLRELGAPRRARRTAAERGRERARGREVRRRTGFRRCGVTDEGRMRSRAELSAKCCRHDATMWGCRQARDRRDKRSRNEAGGASTRTRSGRVFHVKHLTLSLIIRA